MSLISYFDVGPSVPNNSRINKRLSKTNHLNSYLTYEIENKKAKKFGLNYELQSLSLWSEASNISGITYVPDMIIKLKDSRFNYLCKKLKKKIKKPTKGTLIWQILSCYN